MYVPQMALFVGIVILGIVISKLENEIRSLKNDIKILRNDVDSNEHDVSILNEHVLPE